MALAMTVGATKIQILHEKAVSFLSETKAGEAQTERDKEKSEDQEVCTV